MDVLYQDLENYEDVNVVDELKRENSLLKCKLEEYSIAMDKLQKDFNKLSSEFKKLENNYSSLLKTAKEEIERKTQIITKLNIEKDMVVLNAIQNKNFQVRRNHAFKPACDCSNNKEPKSKMEDLSNTKETKQTERNEQNRMPSIETVTSNSSDIATKSTNKNIDKWTGSKIKDSKENISNPHKNVHHEMNVPQSKALSIKNRRKSMPAIRCEPKFSSDEEGEVDERSFIKSRYEAGNREMKQNIVNKGHNEALRYKFLDDHHRVSEASSMDDKYASYHDKKDIRSRGRFIESEKFRGRDRNDAYRFKRHYSPERFRRNTRNRLDDHNIRQEYGRQRLLESPPPDKYNYQRPLHEPRPRYDRDEFYDYDRQRDRYDYPGKHKLRNDPEEPSNKRRKNNSNTYYDEEKRWEADKLSVQSSVLVPVHNIENISCQSPDYTIPDPSCSQPIREIRNTAIAKLEDPRIHSKKYQFQQVNNDTVLLSVCGRDVDLKMVDTSKWNIEHVDMPKALRRRPSQCSEDLVKDIYMDIENPVSNMSVESGEILSCATDEDRSDKCFRVTYVDRPDLKTAVTTTDKRGTADDRNNKLKVENTKTTKYKIPKLRKDVHTVPDCNGQNREINEVMNECTTSSKLAIDNKETLARNDMEITNLPTKSLQQKHYNLTLQKNNSITNNPTLPILEVAKSSKHSNKKIEEDDSETSKEIREVTKSSYLSKQPEEVSATTSHEPKHTTRDPPKSYMYTNRQIVEGDLELSDETSDCVDFPKKTASYTDEIKTTDIAKNRDSCKPSYVDNEVHVNKKSSEHTKNKESEINVCSKKQKSKKRYQKSSNRDNLKNEQADLNTEKRTRSKKEKIEAKQIKTKFSELFGDSSSLITPEDLGLQLNAQSDKQKSAKYLPVCEDAQDAVDLVTTVTSEKRIIDKQFDDVSKPMNEDVSNKPNDIRDKIICKIPRVDINDKGKKSKRREDDFSATNDVVIEQKLPVMQQKRKLQDNENSSNLVSALQNDKVSDLINCNKIPPSSEFPQFSQKSNILEQALATSTPQKTLKESTDEITNAVLPGTNCENNNTNHDKMPHVDSNTISSNTIAEQSSNTDTMDSQTDVDAPDVRIFLNRRRRPLRKSKP